MDGLGFGSFGISALGVLLEFKKVQLMIGLSLKTFFWGRISFPSMILGYILVLFTLEVLRLCLIT
jgi:hypothetical protein